MDNIKKTKIYFSLKSVYD